MRTNEVTLSRKFTDRVSLSLEKEKRTKETRKDCQKESKRKSEKGSRERKEKVKTSEDQKGNKHI